MTNARVNALIDWIHAARTTGEKAGLGNMNALCEALGHPERALRAIHVAGTNGKGSVCALLERALRENGLSTGLYTSPYLTRYNERVRLWGEPIGDEALLSAGERVMRAAERVAARGVKPTTFELGTALAFCAFEQQNVDVCVIETGLGGRLDPTNVIMPEACAIATIALDHMDILGGTLPEIAREKAGILKRGVPAAFYAQSGPARGVLDEAAAALAVPVARAEDYPMHALQTHARGSTFSIELPHLGALDISVSLPGAHQAENARLALCALSLLAGRGWPMDPRAVERGFARAEWPGRLEWITPHLLLDGAHNPQGVRALVDYLSTFFAGREVVLLTAMMADKQPDACAQLLAPLATRVVTTRVDWPRALPADRLAAQYFAQGVPVEACPSVPQALLRAQALAGDDMLLVVAGSLFLVGQARGILRNN